MPCPFIVLFPFKGQPISGQGNLSLKNGVHISIYFSQSTDDLPRYLDDFCRC